MYVKLPGKLVMKIICRKVRNLCMPVDLQLKNILIDILLKRGTKNVDIKFSAHERFWNNLHQVAQNRKIGKPKNLKFGEQ
jgi:hypothetical protein